jgi:ribulose-phosphate 3-epimerase
VPHPVQVAPSLLSADFAALGDSVRRVQDAGCDVLHLDVMDGHFVPNLTFGPAVVKAVKRVSRLPLDVHLMIEAPERWLDEYADAGADWLTFHVEACRDPAAALERIRALGVRPGITLRPGTPFADVEPFLDRVDLVLIMTVEPGFGGQAFLDVMLPKIRRARAAVDGSGVNVAIQVDGGITEETITRAAEAGANVFVAGSAVYGKLSPADAIESLRANGQLAFGARALHFNKTAPQPA